MPLANLPSGADIHFETYGDGEPLVLIPSTGFSCEAWKPSQMELAESAHLILHDPRGCGRSRSRQRVLTITQMANDVIALLDHLDLKSAHLVGHSMGGRIGLEAALNFPGRVKSLIMAASGSGQVPRPGADCVPGVPHWLLRKMVANGFEASLREEYTDTDAFFTDDYRRLHRDDVEAFFARVYPTHARLDEYLQLVTARHAWEATHRLEDVTCPTMILIGDHDTGRSNHVAQAKILQNRIAGAELRILKGQAHGFFWQAAPETNEVIVDWIERVQAGLR